MTQQSPALTSVAWAEKQLDVCGAQISYLVAGSGPPIVVLPRDNGHPPKHEFLDLLAEKFTVYYPWFPGFHAGHPEEWEWLLNARDLAVVMRQFVDGLMHDQVALMGLGFGGWIAAEMAAMESHGLDALVLVGPMGIKPEAGYIYDQFLVSTESYARAAFADEGSFEAIYGGEPDFDQLESWETDRDTTSRIAWKPYMYNQTLPKLLAGVPTSALIVWGAADEIVPPSCGALYASALPNATLEVMSATGHAVDLEQPRGLAATVISFLQNTQNVKA